MGGSRRPRARCAVGGDPGAPGSASLHNNFALFFILTVLRYIFGKEKITLVARYCQLDNVSA
jgi:hypothetical protein